MLDGDWEIAEICFHTGQANLKIIGSKGLLVRHGH